MRQTLRAVPSVFSEEEKLSIADHTMVSRAGGVPHGSIPDVAVLAHRAGDPVVGEQARELPTGLLRSLVRMMAQRVRDQ